MSRFSPLSLDTFRRNPTQEPNGTTRLRSTLFDCGFRFRGGSSCGGGRFTNIAAQYLFEVYFVGACFAVFSIFVAFDTLNTRRFGRSSHGTGELGVPLIG